MIADKCKQRPVPPITWSSFVLSIIIMLVNIQDFLFSYIQERGIPVNLSLVSKSPAPPNTPRFSIPLYQRVSLLTKIHTSLPLWQKFSKYQQPPTSARCCVIWKKNSKGVMTLGKSTLSWLNSYLVGFTPSIKLIP